MSVIIPTKDRCNLLKRAIDSVLLQDYPNIELIVVDDGSIDSTEMICAHYAETHQNIVYHRMEKSGGANKARNKAINISTGEYIAGLDDDDTFCSNHISTLIAAESKTYSFVAARSIQMTQSGKTTVSRYVPYCDIKLISTYNAVGNQVLVRKERILSVGGYSESLKRYQDYDLWFRLIKSYGKARIVDAITQKVDYSTPNQTRASNEIHNKSVEAFLQLNGRYMPFPQGMLFRFFHCAPRTLIIKALFYFFTRYQRGRIYISHYFSIGRPS